MAGSRGETLADAGVEALAEPAQEAGVALAEAEGRNVGDLEDV